MKTRFAHRLSWPVPSRTTAAAFAGLVALVGCSRSGEPSEASGTDTDAASETGSTGTAGSTAAAEGSDTGSEGSPGTDDTDSGTASDDTGDPPTGEVLHNFRVVSLTEIDVHPLGLFSEDAHVMRTTTLLDGSDDPDAAIDVSDGPVRGYTFEDPPEVRPSLSPDQSMVAWVDDQTGQLEARPSDLSADAVTLTSAGDVLGYSWSPSGNRLAAWHDDVVELLAADGSDSQSFAGVDNVVEVEWSADGRVLMFYTYTALRVVDVDGGDLEIPTPNDDTVSFAVSADGSRIAYELDTDITVADSDGANVQVLDFGADVSGSPDGSRFVYISGGAPHITDFAGAPPVAIVQFMYGDPVWSPDSQRFAYVSDNFTDVRIADAATGTDALAYDGDGHIDLVVWSPDGSQIAVVDDGQLSLAPVGGTAVPVPADGAVSSVAWFGDVVAFGTETGAELARLLAAGPTRAGDRPVGGGLLEIFGLGDVVAAEAMVMRGDEVKLDFIDPHFAPFILEVGVTVKRWNGREYELLVYTYFREWTSRGPALGSRWLPGGDQGQPPLFDLGSLDVVPVFD